MTDWRNTQLELVGDTSNPGVLYAFASDYIFFFRLQVQFTGTVVPTGGSATFHDTHMILIDVPGYVHPLTTTDLPDFAIAWDSKSTDSTAHAVEFMIPSTLGTTWGALRMADNDGSSSKKQTGDFGYNNGDAYLRTIDSIPTVNFSFVTYIDFALKLSFLTNAALALTNSVWRIQVGTIANATDHNAINADVAGEAGTDSVITDTWSGATDLKTVPEPSSVLLVGAGLIVVIWCLRRRVVAAHR